MEPSTTAALAFKAGGTLLKGLGARQEAAAEQEAAQINSFIGRTRAIQTDTAAREGLSDELGNMRAVLGANGQRAGVGTFEMFRELRDIRNRERRVEVGNRNQEASDFNMAARNAGARKRMALPMAIGSQGFAQPAFSLFDLYRGS